MPARAVRGAARVALLALLLVAGSAGAAPRIGLVTMAPGEVYWSRFGHNAILVDPPGGEALVYNYGFFDFSEPGFLWNFVQGRMSYRLEAMPLRVDLGNYEAEGRGVGLQWLALDPDEARALADFLAWNARPENARYRYDYYLDNCSTRVRDALDRALGGLLQRRLAEPGPGRSFRSESQRLSATLPWLWLGIDAGIGPAADRTLDRWAEAFVPQRLAESLRGLRRDDGRPLVTAEMELLPHRLAPPPESPPRVLAGFAAAGVLLAAALAGLLRRGAGRASRTLGAGLAALLWLASGLGGLMLLYLWALTDHAIVAGNLNLLLFSPLALGLLPALGALYRDRPGRRADIVLAGLVAALALLGLLLAASPWAPQANAHWAAFWLPLHGVLAWRLWRASGNPR